MYKTRYIRVKSCSSTIKYAKYYLGLNNNLLENIIITAETQSQGVGKCGRVWVSPKGNLYLTAIFKPFRNYSWRNFKDLNIFNFLISLSIIDCIKKVLPKSDYTIFSKWPNDIILNDAKVCGILLENLSNVKQELLLVSIGLNINEVPNIYSSYKAISLEKIHKNIDITPDKFSKILVNTIYDKVNDYNKEDIISACKNVAYKLNKRIIVKVGNKTHSGIFKDINEEGHMVLQLDEQNIKTFSAGEIYSLLH